MTLLTLVSGLPGSGKTCWLKSRNPPSSVVFDDFKANAIMNDWHFASASCLRALLSALTAGIHCFVADIDFCDPVRRDDALRTLADHMSLTSVVQVCFANDPEQCRTNVRAAGGRNMAARLGEIERLSPKYAIPPGATVVPVWRASNAGA